MTRRSHRPSFRSQLDANTDLLDGTQNRENEPLIPSSDTNDEVESTEWAEDAVWVVKSLTSFTDEEECELDISGLPFCEIYIGLIAECARRVEETEDFCISIILGSKIKRKLKNHLMATLCDLSSMSIYSELLIFKARFSAPEAKTKDHHGRQALGKDSSVREYQAFLSYMVNSGWESLFIRQPVLLRLIVFSCKNWVHSTRLLTKRYLNDEAKIQQLIRKNENYITLTDIQVAQSDPHFHGQTVHILEFSNSSKVVYKPRSTSGEALLHGLVALLNSERPSILLYAPAVLSKEEYGWVEFVAEKNCVNATEVNSYFERSGALIALLHVLGVADIHEENLIACGSFPVPVDLECMLQPNLRELENGLPPLIIHRKVWDQFEESVLRVGLIEGVMQGPATSYISVGALSDSGLQTRKEVCWQECGTSRMKPFAKYTEQHSSSGLPLLEGNRVLVGNYRQTLLTSLRQYFFFVLANLGAVERFVFDSDLVPKGRVRKVFRSTKFYGLLLNRLLDHRTWDDGLKWSGFTDFSDKFMDLTRDESFEAFIKRAERSALLSLNVPHFSFSYDSTIVSDGSVAHELNDSVRSGLSAFLERVKSLSKEDVYWQSWLAELSLKSSPSAVASISHFSGGWAQPSELKEAVHLDGNDQIEADRICNFLLESASRLDGSSCWIGLSSTFGVSKGSIGPLGTDLYGGNLGIAVFFASHWAVTNNASSLEGTHFALAPIKQTLDGFNSRYFLQSIGLGATSGIGSLIYGFCKIGALTGNRELTGIAMRLARDISFSQIEKTKNFDVASGLAGLLLGLLQLSQVTNDHGLTTLLHRLGSLLVNKLSFTDGSTRHWNLDREPKLNGFSHGLAGISYALSAVGAHLSDADMIKFSELCLTTESQRFSEEIGNWPDLRTASLKANATPVSRWCHGAGGVGMSRLGVKGLGGSANCIDMDILRAFRAIEESAVLNDDSLCCGNFGNLEFMASLALNDPTSEADLLWRQRLEHLRSQSSLLRGYKWPAGTDNDNVGLFNGLAGIGYFHLRRASPLKVSNVLLFE